MKVKIQQVLPQGFDKVEPHSWECELYKEGKNGQILVPIDSNCHEKGIKDVKIGDFVAVRLDESGKTGTIAGQIVEFVDEKGENVEWLDKETLFNLTHKKCGVPPIKLTDECEKDEQFDKETLNAFANSEGETDDFCVAIKTLLRLKEPYIVVSGATTDLPDVKINDGKKTSDVSFKFVELADTFKDRYKGVSDDN